MEIKDIKKVIRQEISRYASSQNALTRGFIKDKAQLVYKSIPEHELHIDSAAKEKIIEALSDDLLGWGPLQTLMGDQEITEIMINGPFEIYIEKGGRKILSDIRFDDEAHLRYIVEKMLRDTGRRVDESSPFVDFSLPDGSRVNVIIPPLAIEGATVTIRKFLRSIEKIDDLIQLGAVDDRMAEFLVACIRSKVNILFSGATGSGKTTTLEVLSSYIDERERIITIEDTLELNLMQNHVVRLLTKPSNIEGKGEITLRDIFRNTLRMRPTRIILGEIRGEEAMDYLQALNSGHRGSLAVLHASTPTDAITRLETMALYAGLNLPTWAIRKQISLGLDLIVQHEQLGDGTRKLTYITEVGEVGDNEIMLHDIFRFEIDDVEENKVKGRFQALERPSFYPVFKKKGIKLREDIFKEEFHRDKE